MFPWTMIALLAHIILLANQFAPTILGSFGPQDFSLPASLKLDPLSRQPGCSLAEDSGVIS